MSKVGMRDTMSLARTSDTTATPSASNDSRPPSSRSTRARTPITTPPLARTASIALRAEPPVVIVSSITATWSPLRNGPSISLPVPCTFGSLRTVNARNGRDVDALA